MKMEVVQGDITKQQVDAIANAANAQLAGGGGVDGAIHRAAGPQLPKACREFDGCPTGDAVTTPAFNIKNTKWIVHAVGPVYGTPRAPEILASAYRAILRECAEQGAKTVAVPCISTGVYGYPKREAAEIAIATVREAGTAMERVVFCCFSEEDREIYEELLKGSPCS